MRVACNGGPEESQESSKMLAGEMKTRTRGCIYLKINPVTTFNNMVNGTAAHVKLSSQLAVARSTLSVLGTDRANLNWRKNAVPAQPVAHPALVCGILHVVFMCTKKQVVRPDARRVITAMKHLKPRRDRAIMDFPRDTVGAHVRGCAVAGNADKSITVSHSRFGPKPTRFSPLDARPKPSGERGLLAVVYQSDRTQVGAVNLLSPQGYKSNVAARTSNLDVFCFILTFSHDVNLQSGFALGLEPLERVCVPAACSF